MSKSAEHAAEVEQATLASISTKDLVDELSKREGVEELNVAPVEGVYQIRIGTPDEDDRYPPKWRQKLGDGPARILVVID